MSVWLCNCILCCIYYIKYYIKLFFPVSICKIFKSLWQCHSTLMALLSPVYSHYPKNREGAILMIDMSYIHCYMTLTFQKCNELKSHRKMSKTKVLHNLGVTTMGSAKLQMQPLHIKISKKINIYNFSSGFWVRAYSCMQSSVWQT